MHQSRAVSLPDPTMNSKVQIKQIRAGESLKKSICQSKSSTGLTSSLRVIAPGRLPYVEEFSTDIHE